MSDAKNYPYETRLNIQFGPLQTIDEKAIADACRFKWFNQTLCKVNDSVVRMRVFDGEPHWHKARQRRRILLRPGGPSFGRSRRPRCGARAATGLGDPDGGHAPDARRGTNSGPDGGERGDYSNRRLKDGSATTVTIRLPTEISRLFSGQLAFKSGRLTSRKFQTGGWLVVVLSITKEPDMQIDYGTGQGCKRRFDCGREEAITDQVHVNS
jgi:hypothetical protein